MFSNRGLNLALKTVLAREVREAGKAASAVAATRHQGCTGSRAEQVKTARERTQLNLALVQLARPEVLYGNAVMAANRVRLRVGQRGGRGYKGISR